MLKRLARVCLLVAAIGVSGQPNKAADHKQSVGARAQPDSASANATNKDDHGHTDQSKTSSDSPARNTPIERPSWWTDPNWWLVVVAGLTGIVIGWQAIETRKASEASNRSIILQEAALRQWVNIVPLGRGISRTLKNPCEVSVQFEIQNRTDYLVTIRRVEYELVPNIHSIGKFKVECNFPLVPRKREDDSAFPFAGTCVIDIGELDGWGKIFIVAGDIAFLDCMDRERVQHFEDLYRGFADGRLERMKPASISAAEDKPDEQRPNPN